MKPAIILAIVSSLVIVGGLYKAYGSVDKTMTSVPAPVYDSFIHWKQENGKSYGTNSEEDYRLKMFAKNFEFIKVETKPEHTFTMKLNQFADLSFDEFIASFGGVVPSTDLKSNVELETIPKPENYSWDSRKDWRGVAVTAVKNQGQCGSCWAFGTTGSIEGAYAIKHHKLKSFSEQQLVDCNTETNHGCNGGMFMGAYDYIAEKGLLEESEYPYTARKGYCQYSMKVNDASKLLHVNGYKMVPADDQNQLALAIEKLPVAVAIMATPAVQMYHKGIFNDWTCGGGINHAVLAVGYAPEYFIVKNSWGPTWGEAGFIRFARKTAGKGICSITTIPIYPVL